MESVLKSTPLDIVDRRFKQFEPTGVTGIYLLSESHFSVHTWPEHNYAGLDLFSCISLDHDSLTALIKDCWDTERVELRVLSRGPKIMNVTRSETTISH